MTLPEKFDYDSEGFNESLIKGKEAAVQPDGDSLYWLIDIGKLSEEAPADDDIESLE